MKNSLQRNIILLGLGISIAFTLNACGGGGNSGSNSSQFGGGGFARTTTVEVRDVQRASISDQIRAYGTVRPQDNVRITPQVSERIVRIHADLGDTVRAGQVLATLNDANFRGLVIRDRAQIEQAQISLSRDSLNFIRQQELFKMELLSSAELETAQAAYFNSLAGIRAARAALTQSEQNLSYTRVTSPVAGVVTRRLASPGDVVGQGQAIYEVSNLAGYEVRVFLSMGDWRQARVGQFVEMRLSGAAQPTSVGTVARISPELDPVTGLGEVVIALNERGEGIYPGVLLENRINVETKTTAVVIPRSAMVENVQTVIEPESNVIRLSRTYSAFVSHGDTVAVRRNLDLGIQQGDRIEVLSGLGAGEKLIITGQSSLEEGSRIRISGAPRFDRTGGIPSATPGGAVADTARFNQMLRQRGIDPSDSVAVRQARERMQQMQRQNSGN